MDVSSNWSASPHGRVSAFVQLAEGQRWEGTSNVVLQFRPPSGKKWLIRDRDTLREGRIVTMVAPNPGAGCYRVWVPTFNIEVAAGYGVKSCDRVRKP